MILFIRFIIKDQRSFRLRRKRASRLEALNVDEVQEDPNAILRNAILEHEPIATGVIHSDISENSRKVWRCFFPREPTVTEVDCWSSRKVQQRDHRIDMMLSVNYVGRSCQRLEIVYHGYGCCP